MAREIGDLPNTLANEDQLNRRLEGKRPAVFLDYDGTLTPIVDRPEDAIISESMRDAARGLAQRYPVCVVSGRDRRVVQEPMGGGLGERRGGRAGGTTQEGIHIGVMAGTLDLIQRGYMGIEIRDDGVLRFNPKPVGNLDGLSFPMRFRGTTLEVKLEGDKLTVAAQNDGFDQSIKVGVGDVVEEMKAGERHTFEI